MSDTGDLDATSNTKKMAAVTAKLKEEAIREEYEAKDRARLERSVYSQRERIDKLEKRTDKIEFWIAAVKWAGGAFILAIIGTAAKLIFG